MKHIGRSKKNKEYEIKHGYVSRQNNDDYFDGTSFDSGLVYQPHAYEFAAYLLSRTGASTLIDIGAGNGEKIKKYIPKETKIIAVDCDVNLKELKQNLKSFKNNQVLDYDLEKGLPEFEVDTLRDAIVISSDVIEHIFNLDDYLSDLSDISHVCPYLIVTTPDRDKVRGFQDFGPPANIAHVREWGAGELDNLFRKNGFRNVRTGYTINTNQHKVKSTILSLMGSHNVTEITPIDSSRKVLAIVTAYNEEEIVGYTIQNLLNEGVDVHVIDNWSVDKTTSVVKSLQKSNPNRITIEKFPKRKPETYNWAELLNRVDEVAAKSEYDWVMHHDADEVRRSFHPSLTLAQAISAIDELGYNAIDFTVLDFRPTKDGYNGKQNPEEYFTHFEYGRRPGHFVQTKGWKNNGKKAGLAESGGHAAKNDNQKIYPLKFQLKHYPLRSSKQAKKKVFKERLPRLNKEEKNKGWHIQYDKYSTESKFIWDEQLLEKYHNVMYWQDNMVEQISGIGIVED